MAMDDDLENEPLSARSAGAETTSTLGDMPDGNVLFTWFDTLLHRLGKLEKHSAHYREEAERLRADLDKQRADASKAVDPDASVTGDVLTRAVDAALAAERDARAQRDRELEAKRKEELHKLSDAMEKRVADVQAEAAKKVAHAMHEIDKLTPRRR